ncbi:hypothetical protein Q8W40_27660 [Vibrio penaeicida]|uniref:hypothetical protein n=1 Tax=Vibrio penaeicida TaxID=104609 RepID=UPI0027345911|nr:hypothetical protein [Vibrio penaeicida]MDP2575988.1 hypothetical protein [Vibrio penaeicida]
MALSLLSFSALATHNCVGDVNNVAIAAGGNVHVNIGSMGEGNVICNTGAMSGEYTPEACKAALSMLLSAKMAKKKVRLYFRNDSNTSCQKGSWKNFGSSAYQLYYIRLEG